MKTYKVYFYSIIAVLLAVYLYLVRVSLLMASHGSISAADFYYIAQQSYIWVYILIPFHTIFFILYTNQKLSVLRIIRYDSKKKIFWNLLLKTDAWIMIGALFMTIFVYGIGYHFLRTPINWNNPASMFVFEMGQSTEVSILEVAVRFYAAYVVKAILVVNTMWLLYWFKKNIVLAIVIPLVIGMLEIFYKNIVIFYNFWKADYEWLSGQTGFIKYIICFVVYQIIYFIVVQVFAERKDFLNEQ